MGAGGRAWSGSTAVGTCGAGGMPRGPGAQASAGPALGAVGRLQGRSGVAGRPRPAVRGTTSRGQARSAPPGSAASPKPRPTGDPGPDLRAARLQGADSRSGDGGGAAGPASPGKKTRSVRQLSRGCGCAASAWQGRPPPSPGALPLRLSAAPLLPDARLLAGNWTRSGERPSSARRGGGAARPVGSGCPQPGGSGGGCFDISSREAKCFSLLAWVAPELIYEQNLRSLRRSLPRQPGGGGGRRWGRGRGWAWQDWVYFLHLAGSWGSPGTAPVPSGPSPSPPLSTPEAISVLGGGGGVSAFPNPRTRL